MHAWAMHLNTLYEYLTLMYKYVYTYAQSVVMTVQLHCQQHKLKVHDCGIHLSSVATHLWAGYTNRVMRKAISTASRKV